MRIVCLNPSREFANTYVIGEEGDECVVVDPGYNENHFLERYIQKHHSKCAGFLITHGHYDHIYGLSSFEGLDSIPVFIGSEDAVFLSDPKFNLSREFGNEISLDINPYLLDDEDEIKLPIGAVKVIATPYHTVGSVCFYLEGALFSGDSLFKNGIGRSDLPGAAPRLAEKSLGKLIALPDDTKVYPGHGGKTKIGDEKLYNPYLM